jgi:monothiol glutaredoxin
LFAKANNFPICLFAKANKLRTVRKILAVLIVKLKIHGAQCAPTQSNPSIQMSEPATAVMATSEATSSSEPGQSKQPLVHKRIGAILGAHHVVLFMKGTPEQPRCGFSSKAADVLNGLAPGFMGVDVLADDEIRQGIKTYGNWPTIPQLYIKGELVGGCDIIMQLYNTGELHQLLGVAAPDRSAPEIFISAAAAQAIRAGMADDPELALHLRIDARWQASFQLAPAEGHEIQAKAHDLTIYMDVQTAGRAKGLQIDWTETLQGAGLSITNPNAPSMVKALSVAKLVEALNSPSAPMIIDVRPEHDRLRAPFPLAARVLESSTLGALEAMDRTQSLAFLCHFGNSSRQAAEHFRSLGFTNLFNIEGGIDAYAREIDTSVVRY